MTVRIGTAGWSIPRQSADRFSAKGSALERYAERFDMAEINSSFHRPHRRTTYERWAASTPDGFGFSVKLPKTITHERRLSDVTDLLDGFLEETGGLGDKLNTILTQLPPSLEFSARLANDFFGEVRRSYQGAVACEPRHPTWFGQAASAVLAEMHIGLVAADPPPCSEAPNWDAMANPAYVRLHGSPKIYFSAYPPEVLARLAQRLAALPSDFAAVCIFDNTAAGIATENALSLKDMLRASWLH